MDYDNSEMQRLIDEKIHNERNRNILTARLIRGRTYAAIAEDFGLSDRQVIRIINRDAAKLHKYL